MNDKTEQGRQTNDPQGARQTQGQPGTPMKGGTHEEQKRGQDRDSSDHEGPNSLRTGERPGRPIEGERRDQDQQQGQSQVGEEDKRARGDQSPGYSPFRPQGSPDRQGERAGKNEPRDGGHSERDKSAGPMKGNDPKQDNPSSPKKSAPGSQREGDDKPSRK